jgi:hypothetical protein
MKQILIAIDQLANACLGGWADETLSARCWRLRHKQPQAFLRAVIDGLFFWEIDHCRLSYESELFRLQSPPEQRCS